MLVPIEKVNVANDILSTFKFNWLENVAFCPQTLQCLALERYPIHTTFTKALKLFCSGETVFTSAEYARNGCISIECWQFIRSSRLRIDSVDEIHVVPIGRLLHSQPNGTSFRFTDVAPCFLSVAFSSGDSGIVQVFSFHFSLHLYTILFLLGNDQYILTCCC